MSYMPSYKAVHIWTCVEIAIANNYNIIIVTKAITNVHVDLVYSHVRYCMFGFFGNQLVNSLTSSVWYILHQSDVSYLPGHVHHHVPAVNFRDAPHNSTSAAKWSEADARTSLAISVNPVFFRAIVLAHLRVCECVNMQKFHVDCCDSLHAIRATTSVRAECVCGRTTNICTINRQFRAASHACIRVVVYSLRDHMCNVRLACARAQNGFQFRFPMYSCAPAQTLWRALVQRWRRIIYLYKNNARAHTNTHIHVLYICVVICVLWRDI